MACSMSLLSCSLPRSLIQSCSLLVLVNGFRSWFLFHFRGYVIMFLSLWQNQRQHCLHQFVSVTCVIDTLAAVVSPHGPPMLLLLSVVGATVDWLAKYHFLRPPRKNVLEFQEPGSEVVSCWYCLSWGLLRWTLCSCAEKGSSHAWPSTYRKHTHLSGLKWG